MIYREWFVWCDCGEFKEPEGGVLLEEEPKIGDVIILSDKKQWRIKSLRPDVMELTTELAE